MKVGGGRVPVGAGSVSRDETGVTAGAFGVEVWMDVGLGGAETVSAGIAVGAGCPHEAAGRLSVAGETTSGPTTPIRLRQALSKIRMAATAVRVGT